MFLGWNTFPRVYGDLRSLDGGVGDPRRARADRIAVMDEIFAEMAEDMDAFGNLE
jgi:hypothetical protein